MEERLFTVGKDGAPIMEGSLTLYVAQMLKPELEALGAEVHLVREKTEPLTKHRPRNLETQARIFLATNGIQNPLRTYENPSDNNRIASIQWQAEKLFYRTSEIRTRAKRINEELQPDLTLCLHFNAEA